MSSKGINRSRKELDSEIPAEEITVTPAVKRGPGRPRKLESEKKKVEWLKRLELKKHCWVPIGRPRGRPRIYHLDPEKKKGQRGRPIDDSIDKEGKDEIVNSVPAVKRGPGRPRKLESEKKKCWVPTGRPRGRPRIYQLSAKKVISWGNKKRGRPKKQ